MLSVSGQFVHKSKNPAVAAAKECGESEVINLRLIFSFQDVHSRRELTISPFIVLVNIFGTAPSRVEPGVAVFRSPNAVPTQCPSDIQVR